MNKTLLFILSIFIITCSSSCTSVDSQQGESLEEIKQSIQAIDDSLIMLFDQVLIDADFHIDPELYYEAINRNQQLILKYPDSPEVEGAMEKIGAIYLQLNREDEAVKWRDSLLNQFPNNKNKVGILELQMNYYDFNEPNPEKVKFYLDQLLEIEGLSDEKREQYEFRLENIDKSFEELIRMQSK